MKNLTIESNGIEKNVKGIRKADNTQKEIRTRFSNRLNDLMRDEKISQELLAEKVNFSSGSISNYCRGERIPEADRLKILADYFEVSTDYLLGNVEAKDYDNIAIGKMFGFNDKTIQTIQELEHKDLSNLIFNNDAEIVDSLYKSIVQYFNDVKALKKIEANNSANDKDSSLEHLKANGKVEQSRFDLKQTFQYLIDKNIK